MGHKELLYSKSDVESLWKRPYERQISVMGSKVLEALNLSGGKLFFAFSGGKDSTFLLYHLAQIWACVYPDQTLHVVCNDTTIEYEGMISFVRWFCDYVSNKFKIKIALDITRPADKQTFVTVYRDYGLPLISKTVAKSIRTVKDLMRKHGVTYEEILAHREKTLENVSYLQDRFGGSKSSTLYILGWTHSLQKFGSEYRIADKWLPLLNAPFELTDECCDILKHGNIPQDFENWVNMTAEMAEESRRRLTAYQTTGCNESIRPGKGGKSKPMGPVTLQTVLRGIKDNDIPLFKYYGEILEENGKYATSGMYRTGCALCGFGLEFEPDRFVRLYELEPARVRFAFRSRERGGLGYREAFEYCNKYCGTCWEIPNTGEVE